MGSVSIKVLDSNQQPVSGATVKLYLSSWAGFLGIWQLYGQGTTGVDGVYTFNVPWPGVIWGVGSCVTGMFAKASATYQGMSGQSNQFLLNPVDCSAPMQGIILNVAAATGPAFEMVGLFVKQMKNGAMVRNWDVLNKVGSPQWAAGHGTNPQIPAYTADQGGYNLQIEATVKSRLSSSVNVLFRTQTCPRGTSPIQIPPCGQNVDSPSYVSIAPGATVQLPIWELQMWSVSIDERCWVVDADTGEVYNVGLDYFDNNWLYYPDIGYRADDWFIPIDVAGILSALPSWAWLGLGGLTAAAVAIELAIRRRKK